MEHERIIGQHKAGIHEKKKFYSQVRREDKLQKRKLNIEICSELVDLIMDVANEAHDKMEARKTKRLDK